jgi:predicted oxidoreductase
LAGLLVLAAACGTGDGGVTVLAAASLNEAFAELGGATFSFAGSQQLSAPRQRRLRPSGRSATRADGRRRAAGWLERLGIDAGHAQGHWGRRLPCLT